MYYSALEYFYGSMSYRIQYYYYLSWLPHRTLNVCGCHRQAEEVLEEATQEEVVEEDYVGQEVEGVAAQVAVEVLRYYTGKKRLHETKKVRLHQFYLYMKPRKYGHIATLYFVESTYAPVSS